MCVCRKCQPKMNDCHLNFSKCLATESKQGDHWLQHLSFWCKPVTNRAGRFNFFFFLILHSNNHHTIVKLPLRLTAYNQIALEFVVRITQHHWNWLRRTASRRDIRCNEWTISKHVRRHLFTCLEWRVCAMRI